MESEKYPVSFYRGLSDDNCFSHGYLLPAAFQFGKEVREDGFCESSINWNDDAGALITLFDQKKKDGSFQFKKAVMLQTEKTKRDLTQFIDNHHFSMERRVLTENRYHGNLLIHGELPKSVRMMIQTLLANAAELEILENENCKI